MPTETRKTPEITWRTTVSVPGVESHVATVGVATVDIQLNDGVHAIWQVEASGSGAGFRGIKLVEMGEAVEMDADVSALEDAKRDAVAAAYRLAAVVDEWSKAVRS